MIWGRVVDIMRVDKSAEIWKPYRRAFVKLSQDIWPILGSKKMKIFA